MLPSIVFQLSGLIKSALTNSSFKSGDFRATFEAPIRMADLVFVRTFVPIQVPVFYNPIFNLLLDRIHAADGKGCQWRMLKTVGELRYTAGQQPEQKEDSNYRVCHPPIQFRPWLALNYYVYTLPLFWVLSRNSIKVLAPPALAPTQSRLF